MSGTNKAVISDAVRKGESQSVIASKLLNANENAKKLVGKKSTTKNK